MRTCTLRLPTQLRLSRGTFPTRKVMNRLSWGLRYVQAERETSLPPQNREKTRSPILTTSSVPWGHFASIGANCGRKGFGKAREDLETE